MFPELKTRTEFEEYINDLQTVDRETNKEAEDQNSTILSCIFETDTQNFNLTPKLTRKKTDKSPRLTRSAFFVRKQPIKFDFPLERVRNSLKTKLNDSSQTVIDTEIKELIGAVVGKLVDMDM